MSAPPPQCARAVVPSLHPWTTAGEQGLRLPPSPTLVASLVPRIARRGASTAASAGPVAVEDRTHAGLVHRLPAADDLLRTSTCHPFAGFLRLAAALMCWTPPCRMRQCPRHRSACGAPLPRLVGQGSQPSMGSVGILLRAGAVTTTGTLSVNGALSPCRSAVNDSQRWRSVIPRMSRKCSCTESACLEIARAARHRCRVGVPNEGRSRQQVACPGADQAALTIAALRAASHGSGSVLVPSGPSTSKCRCGPVETPRLPTVAIFCPALTRWPTVTRLVLLCP